MQTIPENYHIGTHTICTNHIYKLLVIDKELIIKFTPTEYQLLSCLLAQLVTSDELLATALGSPLGNVKQTVEKHMNNIRMKVRPHLNIYRIHGYGYMLKHLDS